MSSSARSPEPPIAAAGGLARQARLEADPYLALDDLMAAVEQLCLTWPQREVRRIEEGGMRL